MRFLSNTTERNRATKIRAAYLVNEGSSNRQVAYSEMPGPIMQANGTYKNHTVIKK